MEKEYYQDMEPNKPDVECDHDWHVVVSVKTERWDNFMRRRDKEEGDYIEQILTHTLFCPTCRRIRHVS